MEKAHAKGDVGEEELRALEMDVTGKVGQQRRLLSATKGLIVGSIYSSCSLHGEAHAWRSSKFFERFIVNALIFIFDSYFSSLLF